MSPDFFELVFVTESERTLRLGIAGSQGVVLGLPPQLLGLADDEPWVPETDYQFAVDIDGTGYSLYSSEFETTDVIVPRELFYSGESIKIDPERFDDDLDLPRYSHDRKPTTDEPVCGPDAT